MPDLAYAYIMASTYKHLYIGVTSEIELRVRQHKEGRHREKQLKKWSRIKKIQLIVAANPTWCDRSSDWGKPFPLYSELHPS